MKNVKMTKKGSKLLIEVDLTGDFGLSGSGKSKIIASTEGNVDAEGGIKVGLNVYTPVKS